MVTSYTQSLMADQRKVSTMVGIGLYVLLFLDVGDNHDISSHEELPSTFVPTISLVWALILGFETLLH